MRFQLGKEVVACRPAEACLDLPCHFQTHEAERDRDCGSGVRTLYAEHSGSRE